MNGSKSAGIFLGLVLLLAIIAVVFAIIKKKEKTNQLEEFSKIRGWIYSDETSSSTPFKITGTTNIAWELEAHSATQQSMKRMSSTLIWSSKAVNFDNKVIVIAVRMPVDPAMLANQMIPEELKNTIKEINRGNPEFLKRFIIMANTNEIPAGLDTLISDFLTLQKPGFISLKISKDGIQIRTPYSIEGEVIRNVVDFGTALVNKIKP